MKLISIIFSTLLLQASASFFDDISGAFASVENSFSKLLTDVVSDVKVTIDCTIMAVEQTLARGKSDTASEYEKLCRGENVVATDVRDSSYHQAPPQQTQAPVTTKKETLPEKQTNGKQEIFQAVSSSVSKHNDTLEMIKEKHIDAQKKIVEAKDALKNETIRLTQASNLLGRELDNITASMKSDINSYVVVPNKTSIDNVLREVKLLYEIDDSNKNSTEAKEINEALNEVLHDLHDNSTAASTNEEFKEIIRDLEDTSNNTFTDIESQLSQWKDDEQKHLADIKLLIENRSEESEDRFPKSFRDVTKKILDEMNSVETVTDEAEVTEALVTQPTEAPKLENTPKNEPTSIDLDADFINSYFAKSYVPREVAAQDAADVMEQSEYAQAIMDSLYGSANNDEVINIFDDPAVLAF